jgi:type IV pilus assembly protein PilA
MKKCRNARRVERGFTLVELMIVVGIIGVLAALAIFGVSRYVKHSKTAEATRNLGAIENGSRNSYAQETDSSGTGVGPFVHKFCASAAMQPASVPSGQRVKLISGAGTGWNLPGWTCLKFAINEPQFYAYQYINNGSSGTAANYTAIANGDLDGNGVQSTFKLVGRGGQTGDAERVSILITQEDE